LSRFFRTKTRTSPIGIKSWWKAVGNSAFFPDRLTFHWEALL